MKLTPNLTIETMDRLRNEKIWGDRESVARARNLLEDAVLFDFGTLRPSIEHTSFALDLYERGLFRLPYPITAFHSKIDGKESLLILIQHQENGLLAALLVIPIAGDGWNPEGALPGLLVRDDVPLQTPPPGMRPASVVKYLRDDLNKHMLGDNYLQEMIDGTDALAVECMGYVAMLMSKGVETKHVEAPVKLNKARAKRRKPLISDHYVVTIDVNKYVRHAEGEHARGSPRPHWRRGHIRRWETSTGETRLIPIAPTLVAVREDSPVAKPTYRAKA